jgi:hypothetical protein
MKWNNDFRLFEGIIERRTIGLRLFFVVFVGGLVIGSVRRAVSNEPIMAGPVCRGMCDASGAVSVGKDYFLVGNDEDNILRLYQSDRGEEPAGTFDMSDFIKPDPDKPESDFESAAQLGDLVFWMTSHGRNKSDKPRASRHRFFATRITGAGESVEVRGVGAPYTSLLDDLVSDPRLKKYKLAEASQLAPKKKGALNIEGLAATPDGKLLIGFRNPIPDDRALVLPLENPRQVIEGQKARFGAPIELDLGGLGIRDMVFDASRKAYLIVAGSFKSGGKVRLYRWSGDAAAAPQWAKAVDFDDLNPEALVVYPGESGRIQFLSDDGTRPVGNQECKKVDPSQRSFRTAWLRTGR